MKVFVVLLVAVVALVSCRPDEKYTVKYDGVDIKEILNNERLLKNYYECLTDKKTCPPDGAELKSVLSDALQSECSKCSEKQKAGSKEVIRHIYKNKPDWFAELKKKYDPEGVYEKKYEKELKTL